MEVLMHLQEIITTPHQEAAIPEATEIIPTVNTIRLETIMLVQEPAAHKEAIILHLEVQVAVLTEVMVAPDQVEVLAVVDVREVADKN